jgi:ABC-type glycerol-3-phosphate transport system permease component
MPDTAATLRRGRLAGTSGTSSVLIHALLIFGAVIMVAPFFWELMTSLRRSRSRRPCRRRSSPRHRSS